MTVNLRDWAHTATFRGWGAGWPSCTGAAGNLAIVTFARTAVRVSVHKRIARLVQILADETERRGHLAKLGQTGAYNCRKIAGTNSPSNHSWGIAIDWNWTDNPYSTNPKHTNPQWMYDLWARYGFANGSMYSGAKDWMHIEFMGSMVEADLMTQLAMQEILGNPSPTVPIIPPQPAPGAPATTITWTKETDVILPVLYKGDGVKGTPRGILHWYVLRLQAMLQPNISGVQTACPMDGVFGDSTVAAVKAFQTARKIIADGACGPVTWSWILGNLAPDYG